MTTVTLAAAYIVGWFIVSTLIARTQTATHVKCVAGCKYYTEHLDPHNPACIPVQVPQSLHAALATGIVWPAAVFYYGVKAASTAGKKTDAAVRARMLEEQIAAAEREAGLAPAPAPSAAGPRVDWSYDVTCSLCGEVIHGHSQEAVMHIMRRIHPCTKNKETI